MNENKIPLLQVNNCSKDFLLRGFSHSRSVVFHALTDVSFELFPQETYALVGESGSGKSTTGKIICALEKPTSGSVVFNDDNYVDYSPTMLRERIRANIQMVFQDPFSALNPRKKIGSALIEAMAIQHVGDSRAERQSMAASMLHRVGLTVSQMDRYPHQFSGGQLQRVNIARALVIHPKILILDESVSALDVSVQAQVLNLLRDLQEEYSLTYLFITHDLSVVRFIADRVGVLCKGKLVEEQPVSAIFDSPQTSYTRQLLDSIPIPDPSLHQLLE